LKVGFYHLPKDKTHRNWCDGKSMASGKKPDGPENQNDPDIH